MLGANQEPGSRGILCTSFLGFCTHLVWEVESQPASESGGEAGRNQGAGDCQGSKCIGDVGMIPTVLLRVATHPDFKPDIPE